MVTNDTGTSIDDPKGITVGPDGALWFTNWGSDSIGRITTAGVVTTYTGTGIDDPEGITAGSDGALWFTNLHGASVGRITTTGAVPTYTGTGTSFPAWITSGPDGNLWFTQRRQRHDREHRQPAAHHGGGHPIERRHPIGRSRALDASASANVTSVSFEISGGTLSDQVISGGPPTIYGWLGQWNTTTVPNGTLHPPERCLLREWRERRSAPVTITVDNPPPTTAVLVPSNGATQSGGAANLDASASANVTSVSFEISGGTLSDQVISSGSPPLRLARAMEHDHGSQRHLHPPERCHLREWRERHQRPRPNHRQQLNLGRPNSRSPVKPFEVVLTGPHGATSGRPLGENHRPVYDGASSQWVACS